MAVFLEMNVTNWQRTTGRDTNISHDTMAHMSNDGTILGDECDTLKTDKRSKHHIICMAHVNYKESKLGKDINKHINENMLDEITTCKLCLPEYVWERTQPFDFWLNNIATDKIWVRMLHFCLYTAIYICTQHLPPFSYHVRRHLYNPNTTCHLGSRNNLHFSTTVETFQTHF